MPLFTIFGSGGFIGRHTAELLSEEGHEVMCPPRNATIDGETNLGHVIYCAGVTADFRSRPYDTMEAHVSLPARIMQHARFDSLLYLSSTRVYGNGGEGDETARLSVSVSSPGDFYNLSKMAGEALCLNHASPHVRVARISNVYGERMFTDDLTGANFLAGIIGEALLQGRIRLGTHPDSTKDYVDIADVTRALILIAMEGDERLYNIAVGRRVSHREIVSRIAGLTGCAIETTDDAPLVAYPEVSPRRLADLHSKTGATWAPANLSARLPALVSAARQKWRINEGVFA